ncbi:Type VI secretion system, phage-baseplate injector, partial [Alkalispirochaeta americana]
MNHMNQFLFYAVVTDNQDPAARARIKARLSVAGEQVETGWIPTVQPYASSECGTLLLPEVGDQVVIAFFDDTLSQGVVLGGVWTDSRPAPESGENGDADFNGNGENNLRFFRSRSGNRIILDDTPGAEKLQLLSPDG